MVKGLLVVGLIAIAALVWLAVEPPQGCQQSVYQSCFNQLSIDPERDWGKYSFVVLGHIRTGPNKPGPNSNLQENVQRLFADNPAFVITLGDLYYSITDASVEVIRRWVTDNIPVPLFNAVGNHDTQTKSGQDPQRYAAVFGNADFDFVLGSELFVFLEKGATPVLSEEQSEHLKHLLEQAAKDSDIRNIFLMSHQVFWSYYNPELEPVFRFRHPVRPPEDYRYFLDELKPLLESMPADKRIFLMAGDIGGGRKYLQTFYHQDGAITYVATGMGNPGRDSFVTVSIDNGKVSLKNTHLASGEVSSLENYGLDYWVSFYRDHPKLAAAADRIGETE